MTNILKPTPREKAYSDGWESYFADRNTEKPTENPYSVDSDKELYESWEDGRGIAKRVSCS